MLPGYRNLVGLFAQEFFVKKAHRPGPVGHVFGPDIHIFIEEYPFCLLAQRVLVDFQYLIIGQQAQRKLIQLRQIAADQQRAGQQTP